MCPTASADKGAQRQNDIPAGEDQHHRIDDQQLDNMTAAENGGASMKPTLDQPSRNAVCDRCNKRINGIRYKCQQCPDFDYCTTCARLASSIHPNHGFIPLKGTDPLSEEELLEHAHHTDDESLEATSFRLNGKDTSMPAALCLSCQPVTMPLAAIGTILADENVRRQNQKGLQLRWPARLSSLVEATVGGCAFCSLVLYRFFGPGNAFFFGYEPEVPWMRQTDNRLHKDVINNAMHLLTLMRSDEFVFAVEPTREKGMAESDFRRLRIELVEAKQGKEVLDRALASRGQQYIEMDVYAVEGNPAADFITARPPNPSPGSSKGLDQARSWLTQCEQEHGQACATRHSPLPTRVIDTSDDSKLRLLENHKVSTGRYVALSYCWGEGQEFQTTKGSLADRLEGFALTNLPKTLQDAVTISRALGIDYLWVDSICIIQDDPLDRANEIKGMANIYKNATVTITARKADSASKGFLQDGADPETGLWKNLVPLAFPIPNPAAKSIREAFEMPRKVFGTVWLCDEDPDMSATFRSPVDRRGWCLQERLLSSRVLSYGRWPTWRCCLGTWTDGGFYPHNQKKERHERQFTKCLAERRSRVDGLGSRQTDLHTSNQLLQSWYKLLNEYTQRGLGVKADRLPGIGGIAAETSRATSFDYLAGLWQFNLLHDLMWFARAKEWLTRPEGYVGPTWSWATVDCPVSYDEITEDSLALAQVMDCQIETGPSGAFGEISGGYLEIEGPFLAQIERDDILSLLRDQVIAEPPPKSNNVQEWYRQIMEHINNRPKTRQGQGGAKPEEEQRTWEDQLPDDVSVLVTFSRDWRVVHEQRAEGVFYSGLLLRRVVEDRYERIGAFVNEQKGWLDLATGTWERRKVVLV